MTTLSEDNQSTGARWPFAVLLVLLVAFLIALPLMFVHPGLVLILFWLGLIVVLGVALFTGVLRRIARKLTGAHQDEA